MVLGQHPDHRLLDPGGRVHRSETREPAGALPSAALARSKMGRGGEAGLAQSECRALSLQPSTEACTRRVEPALAEPNWGQKTSGWQEPRIPLPDALSPPTVRGITP